MESQILKVLISTHAVSRVLIIQQMYHEMALFQFSRVMPHWGHHVKCFLKYLINPLILFLDSPTSHQNELRDKLIEIYHKGLYV